MSGVAFIVIDVPMAHCKHGFAVDAGTSVFQTLRRGLLLSQDFRLLVSRELLGDVRRAVPNGCPRRSVGEVLTHVLVIKVAIPDSTAQEWLLECGRSGSCQL